MFHPQQQIGPYLLIRLLGQGGFGQVWLAEKPGKLMTTQVAVKLPLDPNPDLDAIRHEAQTWLRASGHPNVLPVIDADIHSGQVVIVSEYAAGGSLSSWLKQNGGKAPSQDAALAMTAGILAGLEYLHSLKPEPIIHRDLKPDNILLQGGLPRLTDFGISRVLKTTAQTKSASGTPHYMPPEAFAGKYSPRSDVWATGVMLYQMLSGSLPFPQADLPSLYGAILTGSPPSLPDDVPQALQAAVGKALSKDPAHRFASAAEMQAALKGGAAPVVVPVLTDDVPKPDPDKDKNKAKKVAEKLTAAESVASCACFLIPVAFVVGRAIHIYTVDVPKEGLLVDLYSRISSIALCGIGGFMLGLVVVCVVGVVQGGGKHRQDNQK